MKTLFLLLAVLFTLPFSGRSQCTGATGLPIFNTTFGSGIGTGAALPAGVTNLGYNAATCIGDGYYTILSKSTACWNGDWDTLTDHTGNANGYFMLINAHANPNEFYTQIVNGLCEGTTYKFSAWVSNINNRVGYINPNITMNIETIAGVVLQTFNTGNILHTTPASWQQCNMYFMVPPGNTSIKLKIKNNAAGGNGNDMGLDDISLRPVGPDITITTPGFSGEPLLICDETTVPITAIVGSCFPNTVYQWQKSLDNGITWADIVGATTTTYSYIANDTGTFKFRVVIAQSGNINNLNCNVFSSVKTIIVRERPLPVIQTNGQLLSTTMTYASYQWYRNGVAIPAATSSTYNVTLSGDYTVKVTASNNCDGTSPPVNIKGVGVSSINAQSIRLSIFPNPSGGKLNITIEGISKNETVQIELINTMGQKVQTLYNGNLSAMNGSIDLPQVTAGTYFIRIVSDGDCAIKPLSVL